MTYFVSRTCTEINETGSQDKSEQSSRPIEEFREDKAFVLLGAPGAGKTTAFRQEADHSGGCYVTARDLIIFNDRPEWHDTTLYIDGLDESRAGTPDGRTPLDSIRAKLDELGRPPFRLSCRVADWFGANDRTNLEKVSGSGNIKVLLLDPLSDDDIRKILQSRSESLDATSFVASARKRRVEDLLANPQTLKMFVDVVVAKGSWPESRMETFDLACKTLFEEHNEEHKIAKHSDTDYPNITCMMNAAGRLCAIQLLTGSKGWNILSGSGSNIGYLALEKISVGKRQTYLHVLGNKLFEGPGENLVAPVHRYIGEFLAAKHLSKLINDGLPIGRLLSLMTGHDGIIVSELRGLSAWLATHSKYCRVELIKRDPVGTVLYGDVQKFSIDEKCLLMERLELETNRNPWFIKTIPLDSRMGDIATPDMEDVFLQQLSKPTQGDAQQSFVLLLLLSLRHGQLLPKTADHLVKIVRDDKWKQGIRTTALRTLLRQWRSNEAVATELEALLADVDAGSVSDPDDDLLGSLLTELYPDKLSPHDILRYLHIPKNTSLIGQYILFWRNVVPEKSTNAQLAQLLDKFVERYEYYYDKFKERKTITLKKLPTLLLYRYLETCQEEIDANRLFGWLGVATWGGALSYNGSYREDECIRTWFERRPELQKLLFTIGVERCAGSPECTNLSEFKRCMYWLERRYFNAKLPADFGRWCLGQAMDATDIRVADYFIHRVAGFVHNRYSDEGLSRKIVEERIAGDNKLVSAFNKQLAELEVFVDENKSSEDSFKTQKQQRQQQWRESLRPHQTALLENRCAPEVLEQLAQAYYGAYVDIKGNNPEERLQDLVGDDKNLIQAILKGLRESIYRHDLPSAQEIIRLGARNRTHLLTYPYMAGLEEIVRTTENHEISLNEKQLRLAVTIHYTVPIWSFSGNHVDMTQSWFTPLLKSHPELISEIFIRCASSQLHNGADNISGLYELAFSEDHANVVRLAALPILEKFPVRCAERQLRDLNYLFKAAFLYCDEIPLVELIERKLVHRSMNVAQRVYWLSAGLFASPDLFHDRLEAYVNGNERRVRHLAKTLAESDHPVERLNTQTLQFLIQQIGPSYRPYFSGSDNTTPEEGRILTPTIEAGDRVQVLINQLASIPSPAATDALETLSSDNELLPWQSYLNDAKYQQNITQREVEFQHCDIEQVFEVLDNRKPANAADLAALTLDYLRDISNYIHHGNTSDWRQYWNEDSYGRPQSPKPENACRGALLSDLQYRLERLNIDAHPEGRYANDKRSDIRVCYGSFNVPVEVKRSCHRDLWSAIKTQLIAKYTRDPGADSYGIYLVFWFGDTEHCQPTPGEGRRPKSAAELEKRLIDTLSEDEKRNISICVIDVAKPET